MSGINFPLSNVDVFHLTRVMSPLVYETKSYFVKISVVKNHMLASR